METDNYITYQHEEVKVKSQRVLITDMVGVGIAVSGGIREGNVQKWWVTKVKEMLGRSREANKDTSMERASMERVIKVVEKERARVVVIDPQAKQLARD